MTIIEKMDKSVGFPEYHLSEEYVSKKRMLSLGVIILAHFPSPAQGVDTESDD